MAKDSILDWSEAAGSNTDIGGVNIAEGCPPSGINNAIRETMAQLAETVTKRVVKSAGYTALKADHGQLIEFDSAQTLALTAAATLTDGWMCIVKANGGDVTIDPNASETIDGSATYVVKDGSDVAVLCDGSNFHVLPGSTFDTVLDAGADIATATTIDLDAATGPFIDLTGTTTVTTVTLASGKMRIARAAGSFEITASSTLIVNGSTSIPYTTNVNDLLLFEGYGSSTVRVWILKRARYPQIALFREADGSGTEGGGATSGIQTRTLSATVINNIVGCSLSANTITLPAGRYEVTARAPGYKVDRHKLRLRNTTDVSTPLIGPGGFSNSTDGVQTDATLMGFFDITAEKDFILQHYCETTKTINGLGVAASSGDGEVYAEIRIEKLDP